MWMHVQYEILQPCGPTVSEPQVVCCVTLDICDLFSNSFSLFLQLLNSVQVSVVWMILEVSPEEIQGFMSDGGQDYLHQKHSGNEWDRTWVPNTSCWTFKTFTLCGHAPSCWENVSTCPAPWMTGMTSFCSCCRYCWFVIVPSTKIGIISPCLLTAKHMVHFAGWCDVSVTLCGFSET